MGSMLSGLLWTSYFPFVSTLLPHPTNSSWSTWLYKSTLDSPLILLLSVCLTLTQLLYTAQRMVRLRTLEGTMLGPAQGSVPQDLLSRPLAGLRISSDSPLLLFRSLINLSTLSMDPFQSCSFAYGSVRLAVISFSSCRCLDHIEQGAEFWLLGKQQPLEKTTAVSFNVACAGEVNWEEGLFTA